MYARIASSIRQFSTVHIEKESREDNKMKTCNLKVLIVTFSSAASEVAAKIREIKLTKIQLKVSFLCSSWCWAVYIWAGCNACGGAKSPFPRYQGADYECLIDHCQHAAEWLIDSWGLSKVRGRDCGDLPADWLTQFMGQPLRWILAFGSRLASKGPSLDNNPIVKGFTSTTIQRRHGDLRDQNIRSFILSWSVPFPKVLTTFQFHDCSVFINFLSSVTPCYRKMTACQCLLMSPHSWWETTKFKTDGNTIYLLRQFERGGWGVQQTTAPKILPLHLGCDWAKPQGPQQ